MTKTTDALHAMIDLAILREHGEQSPRSYLGASGLGAECARQVWYQYHQPKPIDKAIVLRKFDVGHSLEPLMVKWLRSSGLKIWEVDNNGEQFGFVDGDIAGHCDAVVKGIPFDEETPYLLEFKTSNSHYFKQFQKDGIVCNDKYAGQMQIYMHKLRLKKGLFVVVNKDDQGLYLEVVLYDEFEALRLLSRGHDIAGSKDLPDRHYPNKSYFKCKYCNHYRECWI